MLYFIALFFPPLGLFCCGKFFQSCLNALLCLTVVGWLPAIIWALLVAHDTYAQQRNNQLIGAMGGRGAVATPRNDSAMLVVALLLAGVTIPVAFCVVSNVTGNRDQSARSVAKSSPPPRVVAATPPPIVADTSYGSRARETAPATPESTPAAASDYVPASPIAFGLAKSNGGKEIDETTPPEPAKTAPPAPKKSSTPTVEKSPEPSPPRAKLTRDIVTNYVKANPGKTLPEIVEGLAKTHEASEDAVKAYLGQSASGVAKKLEGGRLRYYPAE